MSIWKKEVKKRDYLQLEIKDFPLAKYKCPVSKEIFENKMIHKERCIYTYCKTGWEWESKSDFSMQRF